MKNINQIKIRFRNTHPEIGAIPCLFYFINKKMKLTKVLKSKKVVLTFFTKPDCSLCVPVKFVLDKINQKYPFELNYVDISAEGLKYFLLCNISQLHSISRE